MMKFLKSMGLVPLSLFSLMVLTACDPVVDEVRETPIVTTVHPETLEQGRKAVREVLSTSQNASLSLAFLDQDRIAWAETFGVAHAETHSAPRFDTMYGIGSVSKMFATTAAMILVDRGKIALDTPVVMYVPEFRMLSPQYRDITVRMLLNHSSGFPGTDDRNISTSTPYTTYAQDFLKDLSQEWLNYTPGYLSVYTNDGFTMIENLVRNVSGQSYVQFVQDEILKPLKMNHSHYPTEFFDSHSFAHGSSGGTQEFINAYGSGGLYSTPLDMLCFAQLFIDYGIAQGIAQLNAGTGHPKRILSVKTIREMAVDQTIGQFNPVPSLTMRYGLGWDSVSEPGLAQAGVVGWIKGGDTGIYGSALLIAPQEKLAVFIAGTSGVHSTEATAIAEKIILQELAIRKRIKQMPPWVALAVPSEKIASPDQIEAMTGMWARSGGAHSLVKTEKNSNGGGVDLKIWDGSQWQSEMEDLRLRSDGWFTSVKKPKISLSAVSADGRDYLAAREVGGYGQYRDQHAVAQRLTPIGELSFSWQQRIGKTWLNVNLSPDLPVGEKSIDPRLKLTELKDLEGYVIAEFNEFEGPAPATPTQVQKTFAVLEASQTEEVARPFLLIPSMAGRDQDTLTVFKRNDEEWLRYGANVLRPLEGIPAILRGVSRKVTIGPEAYAEWIKIDASSQAAKLNLSTSGVWRAYRFSRMSDSTSSFALMKSGKGSSIIEIPADTGAYISIYGKSGESFSVSW